MENQRDELVVILAGYKDRMDVFYESNPGLASRIANHVHFPDYSPEELLEIGKLMLAEQQYKITAEGESVLLRYITLRKSQPLFANARSMKNALDRARMRQANRIFESSNDINLTKLDLVTLDTTDFLQSRVFSMGESAPVTPAVPVAPAVSVAPSAPVTPAAPDAPKVDAYGWPIY